MPSARRSTPKDSLAGAAGDRVRAIIEAAEASAAEIRAEAEADAERIRAQGEERANTLRREVQSDVQGLLGSIRNAVDRLRSDLERLEERLGEPETASPAASPPAVDLEEDRDLALAEDAAVGPDQAPETDLEAVRLVALNMALGGAPREEVERHLREDHRVADPAPLLDEVYALVGGG